MQLDKKKLKDLFSLDLYESFIPKEVDIESGKLPTTLKKSRVDLIVSSLAINMLSLMLPLATLQVYDRIVGRHGDGTLDMLFFLVLFAAGLEVVLRIARSYIVDWAGAVHEHSMDCYALNHLLNSDLKNLNKDSVGENIQNLYAIGKMREFFNGQAFITILDLPFIGIFLLLIAYLGGWLVLVVLALLISYALFVVSHSEKLKEHIIARNDRDNTRYNFLIETLNGIHTVKSFGLEEVFLRRYQNLTYRTSLTNYKIAQDNLSAVDHGAKFSSIMTIALVTFGAPLAVYNYVTMGTLIACIILAGRLMQPVQRAFALWTRMQEHMINEERVRKIFKLPIVQKVQTSSIQISKGLLEMKKLSFGFKEGKDSLLLQDVDLEIEAGSCIAITGSDNSGRSTTMKLLAGLYMPTKGEILLDGVAIHKYPSRALVEHIGYLPAQGAIYEGTIRDNITRFGDIPLGQAIEIAALLGIDKEVAKMPAGYDTEINGQNTDNITPGLRQRIAIARAIACKPKLILFDHADRSLDREGYNLIYKLLGKLKHKATIVIISQDMNLLKLVDNLYVIEDKKLVKRAVTEDSNIEATLSLYKDE